MKKNCLLCFLLFFSCYSAFAGESLDSLLNVLDKTIKEADTYVQIKENKLHELKKQKPDRVYVTLLLIKMSLTLSDKSIPRYRPDENKYHITNPSSYQ